MKKIVFFINSLSNGGAEHQLTELASGLAERGYDVTITTFTDEMDYYPFSPKIKRHIIAPNKSNSFKLLAICMYFLRVKADWIIGFGHRVNLYCLMPLLLRSRKEVRAIAGERCAFSHDMNKKDKYLYRKVYNRSEYIVPNSYTQYNQILDIFPSLKDKMYVISNFTDLTAFKNTNLPGEEVIRIGIFGRYNVQKNCLRFVEAVHRLKEETNQRFEVEWYGDQRFKNSQPNLEYEKMRDKVNEYNIQKYLVLNDRIKDVQEKMPKYDAICLPSLWEGFSNSISEAICCGKPCLVSDVADNAVMVKDGVNGFLFDPKNVDSIVEAFMKFFSLTREERESMGRASRKRAEELFDRERFINAYINLIESK